MSGTVRWTFVILLTAVSLVHAQMFGGGGGAGVYIDPDGVMRTGRKGPAPKRPVDPKLDKALAARSDIRQVSLKLISAQLQALGGRPAPEELAKLVGIYRVEYVIFDRANRDILIAGPAEGWRFSNDGLWVGRSSKRPVVHLEDLVSALRCVLTGRGEATCSIDPQPHGIQAVRTYRTGVLRSPTEAAKKTKEIEDIYGLQTVSTGGVPEGSRFARVMVEADYRMKRMALGLDKVIGLTSHMDVLMKWTAQRAHRKTLARWWFSPKYEAFVHNEAGTVFKLPQRGVQLQNEETFFDAQGRRGGVGAGGAQWDLFSDSFTKRFHSLEVKFPIFADLHNLFDLMMVAGLIKQQGAADWLAGTPLLDPDQYRVPIAPQPKLAEPAVKVQIHRAGRRRMTTMAYGGVKIKPAEAMAPGKMQLDADGGDTNIPNAVTGTPAAESTTDADTPKPASSDPLTKPESAAKTEPEATKPTVWWADVKPVALD